MSERKINEPKAAGVITAGLAPGPRLWQAGVMKTKNMRDLERHWAEQRKKAAKAAKATKPAKAAEPAPKANSPADKGEL